MPAQIFTDSERPDLFDRLDELADPWPEFIHHDDVVNEWWPLLHQRFPDFQLVLYDPDVDVILGRGCTLPVSWDGRNESLLAGVVDILRERSTSAPKQTSSARSSLWSTRDSRGAGFRVTSSEGWRPPPDAPASSVSSRLFGPPGRTATR
ncbi:MAG TPA: hypothetical protein VK273_01040 [Gaiellaceae bacterium]|nr:hypothetical protein [Gaiellaceae bacterium]